MSTEPKTTILTESGTNELEIIEFRLEKMLPDGTKKVCYYGINVAKVREVIRVPETTDYPNAQPNVLGVFSLRGKLIPLVDLAGWLGVPTKDSIDSKVVIVTDFNRMSNGFLVDSVSRIHRISWEEVESPSQFLEASDQDCVVAVVRQESNLIMILDFEKIIADINPELSMEKYDVTKDKRVVIDDAMVAKREAKTVLVVDDSAFIRRLIENTLRSAGYNVITAKDGQEGLDNMMEFVKLCNEENLPISEFVDGVVSDVEMPKMDGMHLVKRLREIEEFKTIPIVMFSSLMSDDNRRKAMDLGANDTITKPEIGRMVGLMDSFILKD
ncbi:chemotaxis protein CheV [Enterovibrio paralichthyis]|uniref:chemotaxis protein CheV n=1 Tax=Enterovibrio paralichthyis TaxID=2853805 RepID=UPI001C44AFEE|nr:chemotaxis protein [Enterovibrio paralichthyis]MBV7299398.1 chemotaxis protein [Enterovibrio paralichthyis]